MKNNLGDRLIKIILLIFLIINIVLLTRVLGIIYLPGELTPLDKAKQGAQAVIDYSENLARSYGVDKNKDIIDILAKFKYEIEKANNPEDVASLMLDYGRQTQDSIIREVQNKRMEAVQNIVNSQKLPSGGKITISNIEGKIKFLDPEEILEEETKNRIREIPFNQTIELKIIDGRAQIVTAGDIFNQVDFLQTKVASLERQLNVLKQEAGLNPLSGPGIIIEVYDKSNDMETTSIVHDSDIRNIINELMIAGARGIEVGGQRLTVSSAIRCVGPTILVNNKPIPVNPVVIKAIGNAKVLASSLDIISSQLEAFGIKIKITVRDEIKLKGRRE